MALTTAFKLNKKKAILINSWHNITDRRYQRLVFTIYFSNIDQTSYPNIWCVLFPLAISLMSIRVRRKAIQLTTIPGRHKEDEKRSF